MICLSCGSNSYVVDSRHFIDTVKRRRECSKCGQRYTTYEVDEEHYKGINNYSQLTTAVANFVDKIKEIKYNDTKA